MAEFNYSGVNKAGKRVQGKIEASTEGDLRVMLRAQGIRPTEIRKGSAGIRKELKLFAPRAGYVPVKQLVTLTKQLQVLLSSGVPIVQAIEVLADQASGKGIRDVLVSVKDKVSAGAYLNEAIGAYPNAFPRLYVALVKAGEISGSLDQMLKRVGRYLEDTERLRRIIKSALVYPIIVISVGVGVMALMLVYVIPKFADLLRGTGQELPLPTQLVMNLSDFFVKNFFFLIVGLGIGIALFIRYVRTPEGKAFFDQALFKFPLFGELMQKAGTARFSRTMQTLLASGVNLLDAIDICKATIDNRVLEGAVGKIRTDIEAGKALGASIDRLSVFPKMAVQMISVGETTGNLDKMLEKVADFYETEVEAVVQNLTKMIEPLLLVGLGGMVGGLLIAMYLPIFKMAGASAGGVSGAE